jgi:hypothetical protein
MEQARYRDRISVGCMKNHGSLEEILNMIEDGEQGEQFRERVRNIRQDSGGMRLLRKLWKDKNLDHLVDKYLYDSSEDISPGKQFGCFEA